MGMEIRFDLRGKSFSSQARSREKYDASYGEVLLGNGDGTFRYWPNAENGLKLSGDIRAISKIAPGKLLFVKNSAQAEIWKF